MWRRGIPQPAGRQLVRHGGDVVFAPDQQRRPGDARPARPAGRRSARWPCCESARAQLHLVHHECERVDARRVVQHQRRHVVAQRRGQLGHGGEFATRPARSLGGRGPPWPAGPIRASRRTRPRAASAGRDEPAEREAGEVHRRCDGPEHLGHRGRERVDHPVHRIGRAAGDVEVVRIAVARHVGQPQRVPRDSASMLRTQCIQLPWPPWSSTSERPFPKRRQTMRRPASRVSWRDAALSMRASASRTIRPRRRRRFRHTRPAGSTPGSCAAAQASCVQRFERAEQLRGVGRGRHAQVRPVAAPHQPSAFAFSIASWNGRPRSKSSVPSRLR